MKKKKGKGRERRGPSHRKRSGVKEAVEEKGDPPIRYQHRHVHGIQLSNQFNLERIEEIDPIGVFVTPRPPNVDADSVVTLPPVLKRCTSSGKKNINHDSTEWRDHCLP